MGRESMSNTSPLSGSGLEKQLCQLYRRAKVIHSDLSWPEDFVIKKPEDWFAVSREVGITKNAAVSAFSESIGVPTKPSSECHQSDGIWLNEGFYCKHDDTLYLLDYNPSVLTDDRIGLLVGEPEYSNDDTVLADVHQEVMILHAASKLEELARFGIEEVTIQDSVLAVKVGNHLFPNEKVGLSSLRTREASARTSFPFDLWKEPVGKVIAHVNGRIRGRLCFMLGDNIEVLQNYFIEKLAINTMLSSGRSVDDIGSKDVVVLEAESLDAKSWRLAEERMLVSSTYLVLISKTRNVASLFSQLSSYWSVEFLIQQWGCHVIRIVIRSLCEKCRRPEGSEIQVDEKLITEVIKISHGFKVGNGCDHCINGYHGSVAIKEDVFGESKISQLINDMYADVDDDSKFASQKPMPYALSQALYKATEFRTLKTSLSDALSRGDIQQKDAQGVLS